MLAEEINFKQYILGVDNGISGYYVISNGYNKIIDIIKYPDEIQKNDIRIKEIIKEIKDLKNKDRTKTKIINLKAEKKRLLKRTYRDYVVLYNFISKYSDNIAYANIEEPIEQTINPTTSRTILICGETHGVAKAILNICGIKYYYVSVTDWHKQFLFKKQKGLTTKEKRSIIKEQSIKFAEERFINIKDFYFTGKKIKKINDNICEAALLSLYKHFK